MCLVLNRTVGTLRMSSPRNVHGRTNASVGGLDESRYLNERPHRGDGSNSRHHKRRGRSVGGKACGRSFNSVELNE